MLEPQAAPQYRVGKSWNSRGGDAGEATPQGGGPFGAPDVASCRGANADWDLGARGLVGEHNLPNHPIPRRLRLTEYFASRGGLATSRLGLQTGRSPHLPRLPPLPVAARQRPDRQQKVGMRAAPLLHGLAANLLRAVRAGEVPERMEEFGPRAPSPSPHPNGAWTALRLVAMLDVVGLWPAPFLRLSFYP